MLVKEVAKSTGSHQFKVLREAGLIRMVPQGRRVLVSLRRDDLETRFPGLIGDHSSYVSSTMTNPV